MAKFKFKSASSFSPSVDILSDWFQDCGGGLMMQQLLSA